MARLWCVCDAWESSVQVDFVVLEAKHFFFNWKEKCATDAITLAGTGTLERVQSNIYITFPILLPFLVHTVRVWPFSGAFHVRILKKNEKNFQCCHFIFGGG